MASRRLGDYIERIHLGGQGPSGSSGRPFNNGAPSNPPLLRTHGVNRILVYPGSFNPPHQGHLDLLRYVFQNAGDDLHIIGAIVIMTDDNRLRDKLSNEKDPLILPREQRVKLWRGDGIPVDWAWVYDKSEASWADFRTKLLKQANRDRIDLKFILLGGPDAISAEGTFNPEYWRCPDSITSDISRPVDFRYPNTLRQLAGCAMWEKPTYDRGMLEREVRAGLKGKPEQGKNPTKIKRTFTDSFCEEIEQALRLAFAKLNIVSICQRLRKPKGIIRFVPCNLALRPKEAPSSTQIRQIIATTPRESLEETLKGIALNPHLLVEYVKHRPQPVKSLELDKEVGGEKGLQENQLNVVW
ncbi:hypothetical protein NM208_g12185 [Fusarium decemcellulare]|uniref:Uncharacterized protein n=1 Tax=Fusarium decemcellulare TaxID=57161 RepID=A0ACC1RRN7_9HYPO|nr:hypothetical protein NM208_g12185 [Fusarium decemcellulare]